MTTNDFRTSPLMTPRAFPHRAIDLKDGLVGDQNHDNVGNQLEVGFM
jgi:hypothetical protein